MFLIWRDINAVIDFIHEGYKVVLATSLFVDDVSQFMDDEHNIIHMCPLGTKAFWIFEIMYENRGCILLTKRLEAHL